MEDAPKIAEPFTKVIPVDDRQMQMVIAENKRLNALNGVRSYGDSVRWQTVADALAVKYQPKRHGRLYEAILGVWALLWLSVREWYEYFSAWNREGA
jgi:hypothetical protein